jgi:glycosyltransferase involved in cell wall biosynthesis
MSTGQQRLLSVVLPVYNAGEFLRPAVQSILDQTYADFEFIIIDNCSTDGSFEILGEYAAQDDRIRLYRNEQNLGFVYSLNRGNRLATSEYVARMDADDVSMPDRLEKQMCFLIDNPDIDVVTCWNGQFDTDPADVRFVIKSPATHEELSRVARFKDPISHPACIYRRSAVLAVGGYPELGTLEDWLLWARMMQNGSRFACLQEVLYKFRRDENFAPRRRGWRRARLHLALQAELRRMGFVSFPEYLRNIIFRVTTCLLPNSVTVLLRNRRRW